MPGSAKSRFAPFRTGVKRGDLHLVNQMPLKGGRQLKQLREELGLTMRAVESASFAIAAKLRNPEFACPISRISDIESKGVLPNIYRVFSLSTIYGKDF